MAHILVIDDEKFIRLTILQALEGRGHTVVEAIDGEDGLRKFSNTPVDAVITDILMPNKEGIETLIELREMRTDIPIIAISGGGRRENSNYLKLAEKLGADAVLKKPFTLDELQRTVERCLEKKADPQRPR